MVQPKVQLKLIEDLKSRKSCFRKRKGGLKKKAYELATLCGTPVMLICYGPNGDVETWPEDPRAVEDVITLYVERSETKGEHRLDLPGYFREHIRKQESQLNQITRDCSHLLLLQSDGMSEEGLARSLDSRIAEVRNRIKLLGGGQGDGEYIERERSFGGETTTDYLNGWPCVDAGGPSLELGSQMLASEHRYPYDPAFAEPCHLDSLEAGDAAFQYSTAPMNFSDGGFAANSVYGCESGSIRDLPLFPLDSSLRPLLDYCHANIGPASNSGWLHQIETLTGATLVPLINSFRPDDALMSNGGPAISGVSLEPGSLAVDEWLLPFDVLTSDPDDGFLGFMTD